MTTEVKKAVDVGVLPVEIGIFATEQESIKINSLQIKNNWFFANFIERRNQINV